MSEILILTELFMEKVVDGIQLYGLKNSSINKKKYVQIAELNTVIPTFGVTADAPTQTPITPHFDQKQYEYLL